MPDSKRRSTIAITLQSFHWLRKLEFPRKEKDKNKNYCSGSMAKKLDISIRKSNTTCQGARNRDSFPCRYLLTRQGQSRDEGANDTR
jgi:hypothetical protein